VFNKSTLFNRNDAIPRRDNAIPQATAPRSGATPNEGAPARAVQTARDMTTAARVEADKPAAPASAVPEELQPAGGQGAEIDSGMGARLIVGPEVKLKGAEILDCDTLVVEGRVEATMDSRVVRIAERGSFIGKVSIDIAEIHGTFEGELTARSQLIIHSTGRVKGTIRYGKLVADEGCQLCGDINVLSSNAVPTKAAVEPLVVLNAAVG
jgi:cytoskeletal protein CcmA (bactofilin family)